MTVPLPPPPPTAIAKPKTVADVGISVEFLRHKAPHLARDLAMQLAPEDHLAAQWGLEKHQWDVLKTSPHFTALVRRATEELASPDGLAEKIRRKAALAIEDGLVDVVGIMTSQAISPSVRMQAFGELKELAGLTKNATAQGAAGVSGPIIQINFGGGDTGKTITVGTVDTSEEAK